MHHRTFRARLLTAGVTLRTQHTSLNPDQIADAAKLYQQGWTLHRIGDHYGVHRNSIQRYLAKLGVERRPLGRPPKT